MKIFKKLAAAAAAGVLAATLLVAAPAQAHDSTFKIHSSGRGWCATLDVRVAPAPGQPRIWNVAATYCQPFRWARGAHEVDVLTHGATYTGAYWDWEQQPDLYSYVGKTLTSGRATVAYDRIGNGASTVPTAAADITMASDAYVLHQLIVVLHALGYRHINSISHSYGVGVALAEATTTYLNSRGEPDGVKANALVLTGYLHRPSNPLVTAGNYPANQDPDWPVTLDGQYLTTRPGARLYGFHTPTSDPAVVAYDEDHKDLVSLTGLLGFLGARGVPAAGNISNLVTVPVLVVNGQLDAIFCLDPAVFNCADVDAVKANEAPFYGAASSFELKTVAGSGHDLTLHQSANVSYGYINDWINAL
jgi:hypothetical protein